MEALLGAMLAAAATVGILQPQIKRSQDEMKALKDETVVLVERVDTMNQQLEGIDTQVLGKTVALITPIAKATAELKQTVGL